MKLNGNYAIKQIAGETVAIYCFEDTADFRSAVSLKGSAEIMFKALIDGADKAELLKLILQNFDISEEQAKKDIETFLATLLNNNLLDG